MNFCSLSTAVKSPTLTVVVINVETVVKRCLNEQDTEFHGQGVENGSHGMINVSASMRLCRRIAYES
jgi:hypothetical protein